MLKKNYDKRTRVIDEELRPCSTPNGLGETSGACHAYGRELRDFCQGCTSNGNRWVIVKSEKVER